MKRFFLIIVAALLLFGCATPQKGDEMEVVFYPPLPQKPRVQFLTRISTEEHLGTARSGFNEFLLGEDRSTKWITTPYDVEASNKKIYVMDRKINSIVILDLEEKKFDFIESKGMGSLSEPAGFTISDKGYKYVTDFGRKQIIVYDDENKYLKAYGQLDQFVKPVDVAVYEDKVYVCDFGLHQILILDMVTGDTIQTIGELGEEEGKFNRPTHVDIDGVGNIYVDDAFNFRIQVFNPDGEFMKTIGYHGDTYGALSRPKDIAVDRDGLLYEIFDVETSRLMLFFGGYTRGAGGMTLPNGIYIDYDSDNIDFFNKYADKDFKIQYLVYVTNLVGDEKMNVYGFGDWLGEFMPSESLPAE
jgi:DNA-binding beta-propeller fold protein YncE